MKKRRKMHMINHQKRRIKFKKKRYMLYYILFTIILITTFLIMSFTVFFNIKKIELTGTTSHKKSEILNLCGIKKGDNLILTNTKKAEQNIFNFFKDIDSIEITKSFPETIEINCVDCKPYFCCRNSNKKYAYISKNNRIFKTDEEEKPEKVFSLYIEGENFNQLKIGEFFKLNEKAEKKFNIIKTAI